MTKTPEQVARLNQSAMEASLAIAKISLESADQLARLQMSTVRELMDESFAQSKALTGLKDPQELASTRIESIEHGLEQVVAYSRSVYELSTKTQAEISKVLETRYSEFNRELAEIVDEAAKAAPAGTEPAMAIVKQSMAATNQMIDALAKVAKQVAETADANMKSAAEAAMSKAKAAAKKKEKAV